MKKLTLAAGVMMLLLVGAFFFLRDKPIISPLSKQSVSSSETSVETTQKDVGRTSLFVPYWSLSETEPSFEYDTLIYFGIIPGSNGINTEETGYTLLTRFTQVAANRPTFLTLRMLDSKQNFAILENTARQNTLIAETIAAARENGFDGIVLDLEVSALPFDSLIKQISAFNKRFYQEAKESGLYYAVALYGDTFFRIRPFDVKDIAKNSDEIMIMAYDFHKARGDPGPNFPLRGKDRYGYDYASLLEDFMGAVPKEKLTVIFGLFGYDWTVNKEKNMITYGVPLSYNQIAERFITGCRFSSCVQKRDSLSSESFISYTDTNGLEHLVWFEDMDSVAKKQEFLKKQGLSSFSYWAYSYF